MPLPPHPSQDDAGLAALFAERRGEPIHAPFLAERIIARAEGVPQRRSVFGMVWSSLVADMRLPVPAFVMASAVLLGFLSMLPLSGDLPDLQENDPVSVSDVPDLYYDEATL